MGKYNILAALIFLFYITGIITGCKKEDDDRSVVFPLQFYTEKAEVSSSTRVFTKDGEIKDAEKIAKFPANSAYFHAEDDFTGFGGLYLTFSSKEKAVFGDGNSTSQFVVVQSGNQFLFTSEMKSVIPENQNALTYDIFKYQHVVGAVPFGGSIVSEMRVGYGDYKEIRFPILAYYLLVRNGSAVSMSSGLTNNELNEAVLAKLKNNDTLAVKVYMMTCKAK